MTPQNQLSTGGEGGPPVGDSASDLARDAAHGLLRLSGDVVRNAFVVRFMIVREVANRLFDLAFESDGLTFEFIAIQKYSSRPAVSDSPTGADTCGLLCVRRDDLVVLRSNVRCP